MKTFQLLLLCVVCAAKSYGQTALQNSYGHIEVAITKEKKPKRIWAKVEIKSAFRGGDSVWVRQVEKGINASLTYRNGAKKGTYIVSVRFIIDKYDNTSNVYCDIDPGFGMCDQVIRVVKNARGKWLPAKQPGEVRAYRTTNQ